MALLFIKPLILFEIMEHAKILCLNSKLPSSASPFFYKAES